MKPLPCALPTRPWPGRARCGTAGALLRLLAFLAFLALLAHPAPARAATPPLLLTHERPQLNAWDTITLQADPTDALSAEDMLRRLDQFEPPARRGGSLGVHKAAMWLHIPLLAPKALPTPWVIDIGYSSLQADIYLARGGRVLQQVRSGQLGAGDLDIRTPAMAFHLEPGQAYDLLVRVRATGPLILPITLGEMPRQIHQALREQMLQGLLNGLAFCLLAYSLVQWVTQREHLFGFYALVVLGSAGFSLQFFGIGDRFLWPGNLWMARYGGLTAGLVALAGSFLFLGAALADAAPRSRYARTMRAGAAVTALVCAGVVLGGVSVPIAIAYMSLVSPLPSLLSVPAALVHVRRGNPIGSTLLLAWVAYGVAAAVMVCLVQGWVPANFWTVHSFQFGATLDMLLFLRVMGLRAKAIRLQAQEALRERDLMHSLAHSDPLTGLSNRRGLQHALRAALESCAPGHLVAVYLMDLDGFKPVNDSYGHDVGDDLLVAVGHRLQANVRHTTDVVARLGGDEFIIMACHLETPEVADELGRALLRAFDQPFTLGPLHLKVGLTIGYALAPLDSGEPQGLIRLADAAMYAGKQSGKHSLRRAASGSARLLTP
ncbi:MAG: sensor domain-containing diguanylate cyclase [Acidovorax sp.]|uniref:diguanylate cyclase n=1 Tax=Acidovorax sp. TaxID=1872122 RepID=UPI0025BB47E3|nr:diguanylate cyclase [Acidovorax sp.]MCE1192438.1 sensor domain-containing diguanylate cyclase [Acidovorax sp.]